MITWIIDQNCSDILSHFCNVSSTSECALHFIFHYFYFYEKKNCTAKAKWTQRIRIKHIFLKDRPLRSGNFFLLLSGNRFSSSGRKLCWTLIWTQYVLHGGISRRMHTLRPYSYVSPAWIFNWPTLIFKITKYALLFFSLFK